MIFNALAVLAFRLALRLPRGWGLYPAGFYVRQALAALKVDDLDAALSFYQTALARDFGDEQVAVLREIMVSEMGFRRMKLVDRLSSPLSEKEKEDARKGVQVLDNLLVTIVHVPRPMDGKPAR
jgi:hypothetical protein